MCIRDSQVPIQKVGEAGYREHNPCGQHPVIRGANHEHGYQSVSYTHLDVYKRQACDRIAAICKNWQCAVTEDFTDEEIRMLDKLLQCVVHSALSRADSQNAGEGGQG